MRLPGRRRSSDQATLALFQESGRNVQRASLLLRDCIVDYPEHASLARDLLVCEQEGDRIAHDIIHGLRERRPRAFDARDGQALASALDDIVDHAEQTANTLGIYAVEAPMEQADALASVLVAAAEQVAGALRCLRTGNDMAPHLEEIHALEQDAERISRDAVAALFASGIDPMVVIRWKDIFGSLEASVAACKSAAHVLEGIALTR
jgi:uncharacterized protein